MAAKRLSDAETSKLSQLVKDDLRIWDSWLPECFNPDKARDSHLEITRQMGDGMTGELLCSAGLSFLVFENYAHTGGTDCDLRSDNRQAGNDRDFLFSVPTSRPVQMHDPR